jgi:uncharacterized protein (TIGR03437 family)
MTARRASNLKEQAGSFSGTRLLSLCASTDLSREVTKPASGCSGNTPLEYISHSQAQSSNVYTVTWTPPATDVGDIRIFVAGNAANGNGNNDGDRIYTANYTLTVQTSGGPRPTIQTTNGVVNGATFAPGIVSGSWTTIFGTDLAGSSRIWRNDEIVDGKLPLSLDGVSVNINGKPAPVYYISPTQINVQAPTDDSIGPVPVEVVRDNQRSAAVSANLVRNSPGFFLFDPQNRKYVAAVISDGTFLGPAGLFGSSVTTRPARPGEVVLLFGTGFGPTNPSVPSGQVFSGSASLIDQLRVTVGGVQATVQFAGLSGAGLYQINLVVPDLPTGDHAVIAEVGGLRSQENAFIAIQRP